jgi:hypothetical protein
MANCLQPDVCGSTKTLAPVRSTLERYWYASPGLVRVTPPGIRSFPFSLIKIFVFGSLAISTI